MTRTYQFAPHSAFLRIALILVFLLASTGRAAFGQALPAAEASPISTGFSVPTSLGSLQYAVSASQSLNWGYYTNSGAASMTNLSGDVGYLSNSKRYPFSLVFSGGHTWSESGQASYSFFNLGFSQVANAGRWNFVISDNVSYLPGTASNGLSGVPGVGDLGVPPVQVGSTTGQGVLTNFSNRVNNVVAGSLQRQLTGKTAISGSGSYTTMRFLDSSISSTGSSSAGLDSNSITGGGSISHQIDARNSYGANYTYADFMYSGNNFGVLTPNFISQTASAMFSHQFTRKLAFSASAGPQWTSTASGNGTYLSLFADVSANYSAKSFDSSLGYVRSTNNGFGALSVSISDGLSFSASRRFAVVWNCALISAYTRTSTVVLGGVPPTTINTAVEGVQVSRAIARSLSGYASYSFEDQSSAGGGKTFNTFSGTSQVVGFGLTYAPTSLHLGRQ